MEIEVNNNKAVIYARYSSDKQNEQSIEGQIRVINDYAIRNNIPIIDSYIDRAITGRSDDRPEFQRMIAEAKNRGFGYVLVYKFDRFSRDRLNSLVYKRELKKNGVKVISVTEFISDDPQGILFESIIDGYSEYYSAELAQKVRRGNRESRLKGQFTGGPVLYGYKIENKKYVIDEEDAVIVKRIFNEVLQKRTQQAICDDLNNEGIKHSGRPFMPSFIAKVINNERYIGKVTVNGELFTNIVPPIIDEETFKLANLKSEEKKKNRGHYTTDTNYLLAGLTYCGKCGRKFVGEKGYNHQHLPHYYYKCITRKKRLGDCDARSIQKDKLENKVVDCIKEAILQSDYVEQIADIMVKAYNANLEEDPMVQINEKAIAKNKKEIENIMNAIMAGICNETVKETLTRLEHEKELLEIEKLKLAAKNKKKFGIQEVRSFIGNFDSLDEDSIEQKEMLIKKFVRRVDVYDDRIAISLYSIDDHSVFDLFFNNDNNNNSNNSNNNESGGGCSGSGGNDIIPTVEGMISRTSNPKVHHLNNSSLR